MASPNWKDRLVPASIDGVPFHTESQEWAFAHRLVVHEYPDRDRPHTQNLGRSADRFRIEAFVVGDNYDADRDRLISVLRDKRGPLELVTERHGTHSVLIESGSVRERGTEGRWAKISFSAVEAGINLEPAATADTKGKVRAATEKSATGILTDYIIKAESSSGWVEDRVSETTVLLATDFQELALDYVTKTTGTTDLRRGVTNLVGSVGGLASGFDQGYATDSAARGSDLIDLYLDFGRLDADPTERLRLLEALRTVGADSVGTPHGGPIDRGATTDTDDVRIDKANTAASSALVRRAIAAARTLAALDVPLSSLDETERLRDQVLAALDVEIAAAASEQADDAYISLRELRARVIDDFRERGALLPDLATFTPPTTTSSLLLAQRLYGTGARADELVDRLRPKHPGFIAGGDAIRIPRV